MEPDFDPKSLISASEKIYKQIVNSLHVVGMDKASEKTLHGSTWRILPVGKMIWLVESDRIGSSWPEDVSVQCPSKVNFLLDSDKVDDVILKNNGTVDLYVVFFKQPWPIYEKSLEICRFYCRKNDVQHIITQDGNPPIIESMTLSKENTIYTQSAAIPKNSQTWIVDPNWRVE